MSIGRVGNNQLTRQLLFHLQGQLQEQERLFEQISTKKRILRPSDDPVGAAKSMRLNDQLSNLKEFESTIHSNNVWTNVSQASLDNAVDTWKRVNEIALSAADGTKDEKARLAMAEELEQLVNHMVQIANSTHGGRYIFSGSETDTPPFRAEIDNNTQRVTGVFYEGDDQVRTIKTKEHGTTEVGILGSNAGNPDRKGAFIDSGDQINVFNTLIKLRNKLLDNDIIELSGTNGVLSEIEKAAHSLTSAQTRLGGAQEVLELDKNHTVSQNAEVEQFLAEVEDADLAKLILELNNLQNVYEAALAAGGRLMQRSLLNFI